MWYFLATSGLLYVSRNYIMGAISLVHNLYKYRQDKQLEAIKISKRLLAVPYNYQHHNYYALLPIKRNKEVTVLNVYTEIVDIEIDISLDDLKRIDEDVTIHIKKYLGHNSDFSGCDVTPNTFGYNNLKFKIMIDNGDIKIFKFNKNEIIRFDAVE